MFSIMMDSVNESVEIGMRKRVLCVRCFVFDR